MMRRLFPLLRRGAHPSTRGGYRNLPPSAFVLLVLLVVFFCGERNDGVVVVVDAFSSRTFFAIPRNNKPLRPVLSFSSSVYSSYTPRPTTTTTTTTAAALRMSSSSDDDNDDESQKKKGTNWIEKSSPTGIADSTEGGTNNPYDDIDRYDVSLSGQSFQTGPLSAKIYAALIDVASKRFPPGVDIPDELRDVYALYAMDGTAKEAVKAALDQNGMELASPGENNDDDRENGGGGGGGGAMDEPGSWGDVDTVTLEDDKRTYDDFQEAVTRGDWEPGTTFDFVVRNVPARLKSMDVTDLLAALDPDGSLRQEAKEGGLVLPDEEPQTLRELGNECERRCRVSPRIGDEGQGDEERPFGGNAMDKGYHVIQRSDLLRDSMNVDGTENRGTLMHVMDALVNHGCLIVDVTDGGTAYQSAVTLSQMWNATASLFDAVTSSDADAVASSSPLLPPMQQADGAGSKHAMVGFTKYGGESGGGSIMQFLETRTLREDGTLLPKEAIDVLGGPDAASAVADAFRDIVEIGRDVTRIAVAAASDDAGAFLRPSSSGSREYGTTAEGGGGSGVGGSEAEAPMIAGLSFEEASVSGIASPEEKAEGAPGSEPTQEERARAAVLASEAASLLTEEILDDGRPLPAGRGIECDEGTVSMSQHRMCLYSNVAKKEDTTKDDEGSDLSEIFGAHTDTTFVTAVPVAYVSGLEVYDEDAERWYRPELYARKHWEVERVEREEDPTAETEMVGSNDDDGGKVSIPWHSRYVVIMPGEIMQLVTRNEVPAAVHRVVAVRDGPSRMSAPVLLRARPGTKMNVARYVGAPEVAGPLLKESDGMRMEDLHNALQPSSFQ